MSLPAAATLRQVSSGSARALRLLYEEHAPAAYGLALLVTRGRRRAASALEAVLSELSRFPERFSEGGSVRLALLAASLRAAVPLNRRRRWWPPIPRSRAIGGEGTAELRAAVDAAGDEEALRIALEAVEGISPERLQERSSAPGHPSRPGHAAARWAPPPRSLRGLVLMRAREAARPERRYVRWFLLWMVPLAGLVLMRLSERAAPRLPVPPYRPPKVEAGWHERDTAEKRRWRDLLEGTEPR